MDDPQLEGYNVDVKAIEFVTYFRAMASTFRSNHLMHTMVDILKLFKGTDFSF